MSQTKLDPRLLDSSVALGAHDGSALTSLNAGFTQGTEQSASGSFITFSGIPSGVQMVILNFAGVSISAHDHIRVQLGDAGGIETTGYTSTGSQYLDNNTQSVNTVQTDGFNISSNDSAMAIDGQMTFTIEDAANFTWCGSHVLHMGTAQIMLVGAGKKALSAELTQLKIIPDSGSFDAGAFNIMYI
jgi:hypothetical protein